MPVTFLPPLLLSRPPSIPALGPSTSIDHRGPQGMAVLRSRAGDKADNSMGSAGRGSPRAGAEEEDACSTWLGQGGAQGGALEKAVLCSEGLKAEAASVSCQESPGQSFRQKGHHTEIRCTNGQKSREGPNAAICETRKATGQRSLLLWPVKKRVDVKL